MQLELLSSICRLSLIYRTAATLVGWAVALSICELKADEALASPDIAITSDLEVAVVEQSSASQQSVDVKTCLGTETIYVDPQDDVWLVKATQEHEFGCPSIEFHTRQLCCSQWKPQDVSLLVTKHREDAEHVTVVVIHGNNTDDEWAITRGLQFYDRIFYQNKCPRTSVRLIILSWESERVRKRPIPDYKIKSARAVNLGPSVGSFLQELGGPCPVLAGYSLGVQVVLSTMTHLACTDHCCAAGYRVALIAPALDANFACNQLAAISSNPLFADTEIFVNRNDRVLLAARLLNRKRCENRAVEPSLVGLFEQGRLPIDRFHFDDVTREVRNRHSLVNYIQSSTVQRKIRQLVLQASADRVITVVDGANASSSTGRIEPSKQTENTSVQLSSN